MAKTMRRALAATLLGSTLLASCAPVPQLGARPEVRPPASFAAERSLAAEGRSSWPAGDWWTGYGDPQLSGLIEEG